MKFKGCVGAMVIGAFAIGCGGPAIRSVFVMAPAPPRPDNCPLQLVSVDQTKVNETWQMLGTVAVDGKDLDPGSAEVRALVRPRACAMGGTSISLWIQTVDERSGGTLLNFMVLRPKPTEAAPAPAPTAF
jgi:hypothetical protein